MNSHYLYRITLAVITMLLLVLPGGISAQTDTTNAVTDSLEVPVDSIANEIDSTPYRSVPMAIKHMNFDCYPDTVWGYVNKRFHYLPEAIAWGRRDTSRSYPCSADSTITNIVPRTEIHFPEWSLLSAEFAVQRINDDSLPDIILYLWGKTPGPQGLRDTARSIVIFGQRGLDTVATIDIDAIPVFQSEPFFAMELQVGEHLVQPASRDLSGRTSYILPTISLDVTADSVQHLPENSLPETPYSVRIYPNPTPQSAQIEASVVPEGTYTMVVVAVNGEVALRQEVTVNNSGELLRTLDLHRLPSGYYIVRLYSETTMLGTYPIIVTR